MPTFQKCPKAVHDLARQILEKHESHRPLLDFKVNIDLVFAHGDRDDDGKLVGPALMKNGIVCRGLTRKMAVKDRVLGRGDAEISLDGDWWNETATDAQQEALLDHELHHVALKLVKGQIQHDCAGRPVLKLRKHDVEVGWFAYVAERNGKNSLEQMQASTIMDALGQFFWPALAPNKIAPQIGDGRKKK